MSPGFGGLFFKRRSRKENAPVLDINMLLQFNNLQIFLREISEVFERKTESKEHIYGENQPIKFPEEPKNVVSRGSYLSYKILIISTIAMVSVVFIHSNSLLTLKTASQWNYFIQYLLTQSLVSWAVPFFLMVSGYFLKQSWQSAGSYNIFLRKKFNQLLLPYLLWSIIAAIITLPLLLFFNVMNGCWIWERTFLDVTSIWDFFNTFFGIIRNEPRQNGSLWYVRTLLVLFVAAPIFNIFSNRRFSAWYYGGIALLLLPVSNNTPIPLLYITSKSIAWFLIGIAIRETNLANVKIPPWFMVVNGFLWLLIAILISCNNTGWLMVPSSILFWEKFVPIHCIVFLWGLYDCLIGKTNKLPMISRRTFFLYCFHLPVLHYFISCGKILSRKCPEYVDPILLATTCISPFIVIYLLLFLANPLEKKFPGVYNRLSGGR